MSDKLIGVSDREIISEEIITTPEGFKVHGINDTSLIRSLTSLNGIQIPELERRMRPYAYSSGGQGGAFSTHRLILNT